MPSPSTRGHRSQYMASGPSLLYKHMISPHRVFDEDEVLQLSHSHIDAFGMDSFGVPYSMDKKGRWELPKKFEDIEGMQDPRSGLGIAASIHHDDRSQKSYHGVTREGEVVHREASTKRRTSLRSLTEPNRPKGTRSVKGKWKVSSESSYKVFPEESGHFKEPHIRYSAYELVKPSTSYHNADTKKSFKYRWLKQEAHNRRVDLIDTMNITADQVEDDVGNSFSICDSLLEGESTSSCRGRIPSVGEFVVQKAERTNRKRKTRNFGDEVLPPKAVIAKILQEISEKDESDDEFILVDFPRTPVLRPLRDVPTRGHFNEGRLLRVSPKTMELLSATCTVAKSPGDDIHFYSDGRSSCRIGRRSSDDSSFSPLPAPIGETCSMCEEVMSKEESRVPLALECGHFFCVSCWLRHTEQCMEIERLPAPCMEEGCRVLLSARSSRAFLDGDSVEVYESAVEEQLINEKKAMRCGRCMTFNHTPTIDGGVFACSCGYSTCLSCGLRLHLPLSCEEFAEYNESLVMNGLEEGVASESPSLFSVEGIIGCPNCGLLCERAFGCNQMECPCGESFCYSCGSKFSLRHKHCSKYNHRTIPLIDVVRFGEGSLLVPSLLLAASEWRRQFIQSTKVLKHRFGHLPRRARASIIDELWTICRAYEAHLLKSRRNTSYSRRSSLLYFALARFINTSDEGTSVHSKLRKLMNSSQAALGAR